jgi:hypothetical protein
MMATATLQGLQRLQLSRRDVLRGLAAGSAWALALTIGLAAATAWQCGGICLPEVFDNALLSLAAGLLGIGPVAAFGGRMSAADRAGMPG